LLSGIRPVAQRILGKDVIAGLKDQQSLVRTSGDDLVLIGGGLHGTLYAVYSFLENDLGYRWYTAYGDNYTPRHTTLDRACYPAYRASSPLRSDICPTTFIRREPAPICFFYRNGFEYRDRTRGSQPARNKGPMSLA